VSYSQPRAQQYHKVLSQTKKNNSSEPTETQPELHVDVWSGNHPFFTGTQKILDTEGRVDRFMKKYGMESPDSANSKETKESDK
jgi:ribosomal protein L31